MNARIQKMISNAPSRIRKGTRKMPKTEITNKATVSITAVINKNTWKKLRIKAIQEDLKCSDAVNNAIELYVK